MACYCGARCTGRRHPAAPTSWPAELVLGSCNHALPSAPVQPRRCRSLAGSLSLPEALHPHSLAGLPSKPTCAPNQPVQDFKEFIESKTDDSLSLFEARVSREGSGSDSSGSSSDSS